MEICYFDITFIRIFTRLSTTIGNDIDDPKSPKKSKASSLKTTSSTYNNAMHPVIKQGRVGGGGNSLVHRDNDTSCEGKSYRSTERDRPMIRPSKCVWTGTQIHPCKPYRHIERVNERTDAALPSSGRCINPCGFSSRRSSFDDVSEASDVN
ncbi:hypothetical protein QAD02_010314 [Eretmocerus hayati]|uniref:Uncharacterized protein n=1 Tax=Eretmocerus hayati TaxID=131215 RepID=A0ACC2NDA4_9HYME|nr:hypothetical protein QAD02_010314 [Eretmocerus hayati]